MSIVAKASESLRRCEYELRELGAQALRGGDYETARRLTELGEAVADRRTRAGLNDANLDALDDDSPAADSVHITKPSVSTGKNAKTEKSVGKPRKQPKKTVGDYPQFAKRGEKLVKIGWSKKNKQEYEHTTHWSAVIAFANHLRSHVRPGRIFAVDDLIPVPDGENEYELPDYQIYLVLAWFRDRGLVEKRGREGYVADRDGLADKSLVQRWAALPTRNV